MILVTNAAAREGKPSCCRRTPVWAELGEAQSREEEEEDEEEEEESV